LISHIYFILNIQWANVYFLVFPFYIMYSSIKINILKMTNTYVCIGIPYTLIHNVCHPLKKTLKCISFGFRRNMTLQICVIHLLKLFKTKNIYFLYNTRRLKIDSFSRITHFARITTLSLDWITEIMYIFYVCVCVW